MIPIIAIFTIAIVALIYSIASDFGGGNPPW